MNWCAFITLQITLIYYPAILHCRASWPALTFDPEDSSGEMIIHIQLDRPGANAMLSQEPINASSNRVFMLWGICLLRSKLGPTKTAEINATYSLRM